MYPNCFNFLDTHIRSKESHNTYTLLGTELDSAKSWLWMMMIVDTDLKKKQMLRSKFDNTDCFAQ